MPPLSRFIDHDAGNEEALGACVGYGRRCASDEHDRDRGAVPQARTLHSLCARELCAAAVVQADLIRSQPRPAAKGSEHTLYRVDCLGLHHRRSA